MRERGQKLRNIKEIAKVVLEDPLLTQREIAKKTWLWKTTVQERLQDVKTTKDDRIVWLTDDDFDIVRLAQGIIKNKLNDVKEVKNMKVTEVSSVARDSAQRYTIFRGKITDDQGGLKDIRTMSDDELVELLLRARR